MSSGPGIHFYDPGQAFWSDRKPPVELFPSRARLPRQVRNPPAVNALSSKVQGLEFDADALAAALADGAIGFVTAPSGSSVPDKVAAEVDRLLSAGLERPAIIVTDLSDGELSQLPVRLNVALTRAMVAVRFVGTAGALARLAP